MRDAKAILEGFPDVRPSREMRHGPARRLVIGTALLLLSSCVGRMVAGRFLLKKAWDDACQASTLVFLLRFGAARLSATTPTEVLVSTSLGAFIGAVGALLRCCASVLVFVAVAIILIHHPNEDRTAADTSHAAPSLGFWQLLLSSFWFVSRSAAGSDLTGCLSAVFCHTVLLVASSELLTALSEPWGPGEGNTSVDGAAEEEPAGGALASRCPSRGGPSAVSSDEPVALRRLGSAGRRGVSMSSQHLGNGAACNSPQCRQAAQGQLPPLAPPAPLPFAQSPSSGAFQGQLDCRSSLPAFAESEVQMQEVPAGGPGVMVSVTSCPMPPPGAKPPPPPLLRCSSAAAVHASMYDSSSLYTLRNSSAAAAAAVGLPSASSLRGAASVSAIGGSPARASMSHLAPAADGAVWAHSRIAELSWWQQQQHPSACGKSSPQVGRDGADRVGVGGTPPRGSPAVRQRSSERQQDHSRPLLEGDVWESLPCTVGYESGRDEARAGAYGGEPTDPWAAASSMLGYLRDTEQLQQLYRRPTISSTHDYILLASTVPGADGAAGYGSEYETETDEDGVGEVGGDDGEGVVFERLAKEDVTQLRSNCCALVADGRAPEPAVPTCWHGSIIAGSGVPRDDGIACTHDGEAAERLAPSGGSLHERPLAAVSDVGAAAAPGDPAVHVKVLYDDLLGDEAGVEGAFAMPPSPLASLPSAPYSSGGCAAETSPSGGGGGSADRSAERGDAGRDGAAVQCHPLCDHSELAPAEAATLPPPPPPDAPRSEHADDTEGLMSLEEVEAVAATTSTALVATDDVSNTAAVTTVEGAAVLLAAPSDGPVETVRVAPVAPNVMCSYGNVRLWRLREGQCQGAGPGRCSSLVEGIAAGLPEESTMVWPGSVTTGTCETVVMHAASSSQRAASPAVPSKTQHAARAEAQQAQRAPPHAVVSTEEDALRARLQQLQEENQGLQREIARLLKQREEQRAPAFAVAVDVRDTWADGTAAPAVTSSSSLAPAAVAAARVAGDRTGVMGGGCVDSYVRAWAGTCGLASPSAVGISMESVGYPAPLQEATLAAHTAGTAADDSDGGGDLLDCFLQDSVLAAQQYSYRCGYGYGGRCFEHRTDSRGSLDYRMSAYPFFDEQLPPHASGYEDLEFALPVLQRYQSYTYGDPRPEQQYRQHCRQQQQQPRQRRSQVGRRTHARKLSAGQLFARAVYGITGDSGETPGLLPPECAPPEPAPLLGQQSQQQQGPRRSAQQPRQHPSGMGSCDVNPYRPQSQVQSSEQDPERSAAAVAAAAVVTAALRAGVAGCQGAAPQRGAYGAQRAARPATPDDTASASEGQQLPCNPFQQQQQQALPLGGALSLLVAASAEAPSATIAAMYGGDGRFSRASSSAARAAAAVAAALAVPSDGRRDPYIAPPPERSHNQTPRNSIDVDSARRALAAFSDWSNQHVKGSLEVAAAAVTSQSRLSVGMLAEQALLPPPPQQQQQQGWEDDETFGLDDCGVGGSSPPQQIQLLQQEEAEEPTDRTGDETFGLEDCGGRPTRVPPPPQQPRKQKQHGPAPHEDETFGLEDCGGSACPPGAAQAQAQDDETFGLEDCSGGESPQRRRQRPQPQEEQHERQESEQSEQEDETFGLEDCDASGAGGGGRSASSSSGRVPSPSAARQSVPDCIATVARGVTTSYGGAGGMGTPAGLWIESGNPMSLGSPRAALTASGSFTSGGGGGVINTPFALEGRRSSGRLGSAGGVWYAGAAAAGSAATASAQAPTATASPPTPTLVQPFTVVDQVPYKSLSAQHLQPAYEAQLRSRAGSGDSAGLSRLGGSGRFAASASAGTGASAVTSTEPAAAPTPGASPSKASQPPPQDSAPPPPQVVSRQPPDVQADVLPQPAAATSEEASRQWLPVDDTALREGDAASSGPGTLGSGGHQAGGNSVPGVDRSDASDASGMRGFPAAVAPLPADG